MQRTRPGHRVLSVFPLLMWIGLPVASTSSAAEELILDLPGGGVLPGAFAPVEPIDGGPMQTFRWVAAPFADPVEFRLDAVNQIRAAQAVARAGELTGFRCRLRGGDIIDGNLEGIDGDAVTIEPDGADRAVRIDRGIVASIRRRSGGDGTGYIGPGGLVGWRQEPADSWRDDAARLISDRRNARVSRDIDEPTRARYDIVVSWREAPEFVIALAAGEATVGEPYRFEFIDVTGGSRKGLLIRHEKTASSLEEVAIPHLDKGRLRMSLFVDATIGRLAIAVDGAEQIVETTVPPASPQPASGRFRLMLLSGDVRLESLRVTAWTSPDPVAEERSDAAVRTRGGRTVMGSIQALDAAKGGVVVVSGGAPETIAFEEVDAIEFEVPETPPAADADPPAIRVVRQGGGVVTGHLLGANSTAVEVGRAGITGAVRIPVPDILAITALQSAPPPALPGRAGTLVIGETRVPGCLADAAAWGGGLAWLPTGSLSASGFASKDRARLAATVEYAPKESVTAAERNDQAEIGGVGAQVGVLDDGSFEVSMVVEDGAAARDGQIEPGDRILAVKATKEGPFVDAKGKDLATVMNLLRGRVGTPVGVEVETANGKRRTVSLVRRLIYVTDRAVLDQALATHARLGKEVATGPTGYPAIVALRSGDRIPVVVEKIDEKGVWLRSPVTVAGGREAVVVPGDLIKAIELDPTASTQGIPRDRFERLLTVPRSQSSDPPTHLIRLRTGDYLRGKLVGLNDLVVTFDVLSQRKKLPRQAVVRLIWLHPENLEDAGQDKPTKIPESGKPADGGTLLVQGLGGAGERTTLQVERVEGSVIIGESPAIGPARIDTTRIDRLLIGAAITATDDLPFAKWQLRLAPLPRALREKK